MSNEIQYDSSSRAVANNLYAAVLNSTYQVWNGTTFVDLSTKPLASICLIPVSRLGSSPFYAASMPGGIDLTQSYYIAYYDQTAGSIVAVSIDSLTASGFGQWYPVATLGTIAAVTALGLTAVTQVYINNTGTPMDTVFNLFQGVIQNGRPVMYSAGNNNAVYWSLGLGAWVAAPSPAGSITDVPTNYFLGGTGAYPSNDLWVGRGAYSGKSTRPNVIGVIPTLQEIMQALI